MTWIVLAGLALAGGAVALRRRGRNSGAPRARDVGPTNSAHTDAHGAATQHRGNLHGGGGGLPF